jgi:hypothetical protein
MMTFLNSKEIGFFFLALQKIPAAIVERKKKKGNFSNDTFYY